MRTISCLALALALALALTGCGASEFDRVNYACRNTVDVPAWDQCLDSYRTAQKVREAQQGRDNEESPAKTFGMLLMLLGAGASGYSQNRALEQSHIPVSTSCTTNSAGMVNCLSY